jgi:hypothetical protein
MNFLLQEPFVLSLYGFDSETFHIAENMSLRERCSREAARSDLPSFYSGRFALWLLLPQGFLQRIERIFANFS